MFRTARVLCAIMGAMFLVALQVEARCQGSGFRLLGFQLAGSQEKMTFGGVLLPRTISRADSVAFAWVDVGRYRVKGLNKRLGKGEVLFSLLAKSGASYAVEGNIVSTIKGTNVVCLNFLPGSGGEFVAPSLIAEIDGQRVAEWPLPDYPTDTRLIPEDEPSLTRIDDILGLTITASATALVHTKFETRETGFVNLTLDVSGLFEPKLEYWVAHNVTESTWRKERYWNGGSDLFDKPRKTGLGMGTEFAAYADKIRVVGSVEVRQAYEESVVFQGLKVLRDGRTGQLHIVNQREQPLVLSTGLKVVMPVFDQVVGPGPTDDRAEVGFEVSFPEGSTNLDLPAAGKVLRSTQSVSVAVGRVVANGSWTDAGGAISDKGWLLQMYVDRKSVKAGTVFDITIGFKHQVVVAKKDFRLLVPLERRKSD